MSVVTAVTLIISVLDGSCNDTDDPGPCVLEMNEWLGQERFLPLVEVTDHYGGSKHPQCLTYGAGFHGFPNPTEFAEFVCSREWDQPENVVLIIQPEEGETVVYRPSC